MEYKVGIYCRLSREDDSSSESISISNQRDLLADYANERKWNIAEVYIDDGYTGTNFERPAFKRMIGDIENGKINLVLTKDLSRLGRNYILNGQYTDYFFPSYNVRYIAVTDNYDSDNKDNDIAPFKNILNEMYASDISKKIRASRAIAAKQGKFMGSAPPYGYKRSPDNRHLLVPDEFASKIIKRMFNEISIGENAHNLAKIFNQEKLLCPRDYHYASLNLPNPFDSVSLWGSGTIMQMLKNQVYIGNMVQGKRSSPSFKMKERLVVKDESQWIIVKNTHEPLIDVETWNVVQDRIKSNKRTKVNYAGEISLFSDLLYCADCGEKMIYNRKVYPSGSVFHKYRCSTYQRFSKDKCSSHYIDLDVVKEAVIADIKTVAKIAVDSEKILMDKFVKLSKQKSEKQTEDMRQQLVKTKKRLIELENLITCAFEEKAKGNTSDNIFKQMMSKYEQEQTDLTNQKNKLETKIADTKENAGNLDNIIELFKKCANLDEFDRNILTKLVDKIYVSESYMIDGEKHYNLEINYKFIGSMANSEKESA